jgi:hypothetical protein
VLSPSAKHLTNRVIPLSARELSQDGRYAVPVQDLLDLTGASGASYRFRLVEDPGQLPSTAGNFLYVRWRGSAPQVMCCGAVNSLVEASQRWDLAVRAHGAQGLYIRLNIARAKRREEHLDLVTRLQPPMAAIDE